MHAGNAGDSDRKYYQKSKIKNYKTKYLLVV
jgi:hypothetical protein